MVNKLGFTLIELLIVIAIISVLAVIAYPSIQSYIIQTRRSDAQVELLRAQLRQTNLHVLASYSNISADVGLPTNDEYYTFSVVSAGVHTYLMKAVAQGGTTQENDKLICQTLFVDQNNNHTSNGYLDNEECW